MGLLAYVMVDYSLPFALSIFVAQFIGISVAGFAGTLAPIFFGRDSGRWGSPLETTFQDVVVSIAMIVLTYQIMLLFGPYSIAPNDVCSVG